MDEARFAAAVEWAKQFRQQVEANQGVTLAEGHPKEYRRCTAARRARLLNSLISRSEDEAEAWDGVNLIAQDHLRTGEPFPGGELRSWMADVLEDRLKRPQEEKRPRPEGHHPPNSVRDLIIASAVMLLVSDGFKPTRSGGRKTGETDAGRAGARYSACDAVGHAFGLGYKRVEEIWTDSLVRRLRPNFERLLLRPVTKETKQDAPSGTVQLRSGHGEST